MIPARGQTVLVRNVGDGLMYGTSGTDDGDEEVCYFMGRAAGKLQRKLLIRNFLIWWYRRRYPPGRVLPKRQLGLST